MAAYWGPRMESAEECAGRASMFLESLSSLSDDFRGWRLPERSRADAFLNSPLVWDARRLEELFLKGRNRRDIGGESIDELGFRISVWNGKSGDETASLTMKCGLYSDVPGVSNVVLIKIPPRFDVHSTAQITLLLDSVIMAWSPEWAVVASQSSMTEHADQHRPFLDQALYISTSSESTSVSFPNAKRYATANGVVFLP